MRWRAVPQCTASLFLFSRGTIVHYILRLPINAFHGNETTFYAQFVASLPS